jgi:pimeloyl-ACP methyl ester carboxylesterase
MKLSVNGRPAYAYTGGKLLDPALPCVVFVHGAMHDHSGWTLLARWCAHHGYSALAVDLPGHGRSAGPPREHRGRGGLAAGDDGGGVASFPIGHSTAADRAAPPRGARSAAAGIWDGPSDGSAKVMKTAPPSRCARSTEHLVDRTIA